MSCSNDYPKLTNDNLDQITSTLDDVIKFWFPNTYYQDYWFSDAKDDEIRIKFKTLIDNLEITDTDHIIRWIEFDIQARLLAIVICLDQFSRNIYRRSDISIYINDPKCFQIVTYFEQKYDVIRTYPINQRIFLLLPYRHQKQTKYLDYVTTRIHEMENEIDLYSDDNSGNNLSKKIHQMRAIVKRFKNATLKDYSYVMDTVKLINTNDESFSNFPGSKSHIIVPGITKLVEIMRILDPICLEYSTINSMEGIPFYSPKVSETPIYKIMAKFYANNKNLENNKDNTRNVTVSLSGGVDSMVISYVLHHMRINKLIDSVSAVHVDYGNREISLQEASFVEAWCRYLRIPLITRRIDHMRRTNENTVIDVDRSTYEETTKILRFNLYRHAMQLYDSESIALGHHADDRSENVLMNALRGSDILDLFTMVDHQIIDGVPIDRPLLPIVKDLIYEFAKLFEVPYLADTTSESCFRGVLRKTVFPALEKVDPGIRQSLMDLGHQSDDCRIVIDLMVIHPILSKIVIRKYGFYLKWDNEFATTFSSLPFEVRKTIWTIIMTHVFHTKIGTNMIKKNNLKRMIEWMETQSGLIRLSNGFMGSFHNSCLVVCRESIASRFQYLPSGDLSMPNSFKPLGISADMTDYLVDLSICHTIRFNGWTITYDIFNNEIPDDDISDKIELIDLIEGRFSMTYSLNYAPPDANVYSKMNISEPDGVYGCLTYGRSITKTKRQSNRKFFLGLDLSRYIPKMHFFCTKIDMSQSRMRIRYVYS